MILRNILRSLSLLLLTISVVLSSECDDIISLENVNKCTINEEGKINGLYINVIDMNEDQINKLLAHDLIDLTYVIYLGQNVENPFSASSDYLEFPAAIKNLKNLQSLTLHCESSFHDYKDPHYMNGLINLGKDYFKNLKNLKSLQIGGVNISQENIDDISSLDNLESLDFSRSYLNESLNYDSLSNLKKLTKLTIDNATGGYNNLLKNNELISSKTPKNLVISNKGIKELYIYPPVNINSNELPNLEKLSFTFEDDLETSFIEQFNNLSNLEITFFDGTYFEQKFGNIKADLSKLKNLKTLHLKEINISEEVMTGIASIPNLDELFLESCKIYEGFPEKLKNLKTLSSLILDSCRVKNIENGIASLTNLRKLVIEGYDEIMDNILECLYSLKNLEYLNIAVANIDEKLGTLENLQYLDLSDGELKKIPKEIENIKNLKHLDISHNSLTEIPEQIGNLKNLEYLDLSYNEIAVIPKQLGNLTNLKHIDFEGNQLTSLTEQLRNLKKLEYINFNFNQIYAESPEYLNSFENLHYFLIEGNHNLKGKVLTNEHLIECSYGGLYEASYDLCIPKNVKINCFQYEVHFKTCDDDKQDDIEVSTSNQCGKEHGKCPDGQCCNKDGKCGTTEDYCLVTKNCQIKYGHCIDECSEINNILNVKNKCTVDQEGKAIELMLDVDLYNYFDNLEITQLAINKLPDFHNVENLILKDFNLNYINFEPLEKMEKLYNLTLINSSYGTDVYEKKTGGILEFIFTSLTNLRGLTIRNNDLTSIPDEISVLKNLEYLDLSSNKIVEISPKIGELQNLKEINLSHNEIKEIPVEFGNLKKLEILNLSNIEGLKNYSDFIGGLESLKYIDFTYNFICAGGDAYFPKEIGQLSQLEVLNFPSNWLREIPKELENLKNLRILNLRDNQISEIPDFLKNMEKLEILDLSENMIDEETVESFKLAYLNKNTSESTIANVTTTDKPISTIVNVTITDKPISTIVSATTTDKPISTIVNVTTTDKPISTIVSTTTTDKPISTIVNVTTTDKPAPTIVKGKCGDGYGKCPSDYCCSKYGWCGKTDDYCATSKGCQSEFGKCNEASTTTSTKIIPTPSNDPEISAVKGKCGEGYGKCPIGQCCSKYGWCGKGYKYCAVIEGCQSKYGLCSENNSSIEGKCGKEYGSCPSGQCCSRYGWCGTSSDYCDSGCQSEFGK